MYRPEQIGYLVKESLAGFHRRKLTTGVTVLIMASALLVLALFTVVTINLGALLARAHEGIDMRVFLAEELPAAERAEMQLRLLALDGVQGAEYISKERALADFRRALGDDAVLLDTLEENPLPASYHVTLVPAARTAARVQELRDEVAALPGVSDIVYGQGWIEILEHWTRLFRMASLLVGVVVFVAAVFVISNTVRLTVASSARVIAVMKQVGATNWFIRLPFLCEGIMEGFLGGAVAMGILGGAYLMLRSHFEGMIFFSPMQIAGFVLFCIGLGLVGSFAAMGKYLKI